MNKEEIWIRALKENTVEALNEALIAGCGRDLIHMAEVIHVRQLAAIADDIANNIDAKLVLIAGPSSSGKTTTSKRLAFQLLAIGIKPLIINMDNYFRPREETPRDESGDYDFECLGAMDVPFLNLQLRQLFDGQEIELPTYDFKEGKRKFEGNKIQLDNGSIVVMEGIHGLNPDLTPGIPPEYKFKVYASVLRSLSINEPDDTLYDTRLLRRMVRDNTFRGTDPADTILRWPKVISAENKNIVPYMDNADAKFDSTLIYELALLKSYADNLLRRVPAYSDAYPEAVRLLHFIMNNITALTPKEVGLIPSSSIVREFIGGSIFKY